ncbi:unnamed protein product [Symbiodinium sp. CCMP2592]|nr:unnamed protein product [Symbiodinium sp. CCMP2592]
MARHRADHEIGKKHQKAVCRAAGTGSVAPMDFDQSQESYSWPQQRYNNGYAWRPQLMQQQLMDSSYGADAVPGPRPTAKRLGKRFQHGPPLEPVATHSMRTVWACPLAKPFESFSRPLQV